MMRMSFSRCHVPALQGNGSHVQLGQRARMLAPLGLSITNLRPPTNSVCGGVAAWLRGPTGCDGTRGHAQRGVAARISGSKQAGGVTPQGPAAAHKRTQVSLRRA